MLAQSFKPAAELDISEAQREALVKTLVLLETGKLTHYTIDFRPYNIKSGQVFTGHFNMATWNLVRDCGTVCCIGGTAELIGNVSFDDVSEELNNLFYPEVETSLKQITPTQAAIALRNYLTCGEAKWDEVLALSISGSLI